jgi:hypothetical protein
MTTEAVYVGRRGIHNQRNRNINQLLPGTVQAVNAAPHIILQARDVYPSDLSTGYKRAVAIIRV